MRRVVRVVFTHHAERGGGRDRVEVLDLDDVHHLRDRQVFLQRV